MYNIRDFFDYTEYINVVLKNMAQLLFVEC